MKPGIQIISSNDQLTAELAYAIVELGYPVVQMSTDFAIHPHAQIIFMDTEDQTSHFLSIPETIPTVLIHADISSVADQHSLLSLKNPFSKGRLLEVLENLIQNLNPEPGDAVNSPTGKLDKLQDRIFVRYRDKMVRLEIDQILYIEADRNYSRIFCTNKEYVVAVTLKAMETKLPEHYFFRIHRSYVVNLAHIDEVAETHLVIARKALPVSKSLRSSLLRRLQTI
ncbi:MAG: LytTR family transcriptional regulator [Saprospiraceae bacterium]|nr:LytTR family transcriptional regulator [Saprospiraceae bacterium]